MNTKAIMGNSLAEVLAKIAETGSEDLVKGLTEITKATALMLSLPYKGDELSDHLERSRELAKELMTFLDNKKIPFGVGAMALSQALFAGLIGIQEDMANNPETRNFCDTSKAVH